jgi:predicted transcriptional regulator
MHDPRDPLQVERHTDVVVLGIMLHDESWPWSVDEIGRELQDHARAEDSIRRLAEHGLVHRLGEFVFPTRAARRGAEIEIGSA